MSAVGKSDEEKLKELKIKTGVLKRVFKEHEGYKKQLKIDDEAIKTAEHVVKKAVEVKEETSTMIRYTFSTLRKAVLDLEKCISEGNFEENLEILEEAQKYLNASVEHYKRPGKYVKTSSSPISATD